VLQEDLKPLLQSMIQEEKHWRHCLLHCREREQNQGPVFRQHETVREWLLVEGNN
jgi:hypothetical protein